MTVQGWPDGQENISSQSVLVTKHIITGSTDTFNTGVLLPNVTGFLLVYQSKGGTEVEILAITGLTTLATYMEDTFMEPSSGPMYVPIATNADANYNFILNGTVGDFFYIYQLFGTIGILPALFQANQGIPAQLPAMAVLTGGIAPGNPPKAFGVRVNEFGEGFTSVAAPGSGTNDHPSNEFLVASFNFSGSSTTIITSPGTGRRIRIFAAYLRQYAGGPVGLSIGCSFDGFLCFTGYQNILPYVDSVEWMGQGVPTAQNTAVTVSGVGGAQTGTGKVLYTVETI